MSALLLDTCAIIFIGNGDWIGDAARNAVKKAVTGDGLLVSPVSAWEIGLLAEKQRIDFAPDPKTWFQSFAARNGVRLVPLEPDTAIDSAFLPGSFHGDPADRLLVATARHLDIPIVTRDRRILAYAEAGYVKGIGC